MGNLKKKMKGTDLYTEHQRLLENKTLFSVLSIELLKIYQWGNTQRHTKINTTERSAEIRHCIKPEKPTMKLS